MNPYDGGFGQLAQSLRAEFNKNFGSLAGALRKQGQDVNAIAQSVVDLDTVTQQLKMQRSGGGGGGGDPLGYCGPVRPGVVRIEDIPGRRVPFTFLVDIPLGANTTSSRQGTLTISQEGPFVAVKRMATFQSLYQVRTTDPTSQAQAQFVGRSFGRYRPIHSAYDLFDANHNAVADSSTWLLAAISNPGLAVGTRIPTGALSVPSNMSSFRTMEFDGRIKVINAGSSFPRQQISVPSSMWTPEVNAPFALGALDFFERGEVITIVVDPQHENNPRAGNVDGLCVNPFRTAPAIPTAGYPFVEGQYDAHEGICTPGGWELGQTDPNPIAPELLSTDSVERVPDGVLTIGFEGYRIIQPPGPAG